MGGRWWGGGSVGWGERKGVVEVGGGRQKRGGDVRAEEGGARADGERGDRERRDRGGRGMDTQGQQREAHRVCKKYM